MNNFKKISAVLLTLVMVLGMSVNVLATTNAALIDPAKKGSITIHKFDSTGAVAGVNGNGMIITDTANLGNPLPGITFKATLLSGATSTTTVTKAEEMVAGMTTAELAANQKSGTTDVSGEYKFASLDQGIYLVQEVANSSVTGTVESFLVSIPMVHPVNSSSWLYDVHVYPKNTENALAVTKALRTGDKDVMQTKADVGDNVVWAITPSIPVGIQAINLTKGTGYYFITDALDTRLNYVGTVVQLKDSAGEVQEKFTNGTDFTLTAPDSSAATYTGGGEIKVDFNKQSGLDKLLAAKAKGYFLEIVITTTINESAVKNLEATITNNAKLYFKADGNPGNPDLPITHPQIPEVKLTGLALYKYWMDNTTSTALNNAVFTIYATSANAGTNIPMELVGGTPWTKTTGVTVTVTGGTAIDGYIYFSQSDLMKALGYKPADASDIIAFETNYTKFYLVETTAPAGFKLLNQIVTVPLGTTAKVENVKSPNFTLPITGGSGTLLFTIIGVFLIGGGVSLRFLSRKTKKSPSKQH